VLHFNSYSPRKSQCRSHDKIFYQNFCEGLHLRKQTCLLH